MLIGVVVIIPRCCRQHQKFFSIIAHSTEKIIRVIAYNADHFSVSLPTKQKSTLISVHLYFFALLPTKPIIFLRCGPQRGKTVSVVAYTAEKLSVLLTTTWKNVRI